MLNTKKAHFYILFHFIHIYFLFSYKMNVWNKLTWYENSHGFTWVVFVFKHSMSWHYILAFDIHISLLYFYLEKEEKKNKCALMSIFVWDKTKKANTNLGDFFVVFVCFFFLKKENKRRKNCYIKMGMN